MAEFMGFEQMAADFHDLADNAEEQADIVAKTAFDTQVEGVAESIVRGAQWRAPVKTGRLMNSIDYYRVGYADYRIGSPLDYAEHVEYGTAPHTIEGDPLHFFADGSEVFATKVNHPGTEAQPFLRPAFRAHRTELQKRMERFVREVWQEVGDV